jgi:hypothetical protein
MFFAIFFLKVSKKHPDCFSIHVCWFCFYSRQ